MLEAARPGVFEGDIAAAGAAVQFRGGGDPPPGGPVLGSGDRALLVQMLSNLVENAILHTPRGTNITLALAMEQGRATVRVSDDGPGVPAAEHAKLFRRLYRREASRSTPGYGLGLSMVAAIAELHGASIEATHAGERGLAFIIAFPHDTAA